MAKWVAARVEKKKRAKSPPHTKISCKKCKQARCRVYAQANPQTGAEDSLNPHVTPQVPEHTTTSCKAEHSSACSSSGAPIGGGNKKGRSLATDDAPRASNGKGPLRGGARGDARKRRGATTSSASSTPSDGGMTDEQVARMLQGEENRPATRGGRMAQSQLSSSPPPPSRNPDLPVPRSFPAPPLGNRLTANLEPGVLVEVDCGGSWFDATVVRIVPVGVKVRFDVDGSTEVLPTCELPARVRLRRPPG